MSTRLLTVGPHTFACHERGAGSPVVLLHSGGFSSRQWRKLGDELVTTHRVMAPDLLGYGASSRWPEGMPFHLHDDIAALSALLDELPAVHLVGHSYGGLLALLLTLERPGSVRSLSLFEPVAFGILDPVRDAELRASVSLSTNYDGEPWLRAFVDWWNGPGAWDALAGETRGAFQDVGWKLFQEVTDLSTNTTDAQTYGLIAAPTLLLGGAATRPAELRVLERLHAALPSAQLRLFADVGHMGPITHAALINRAIVEHIQSVP